MDLNKTVAALRRNHMSVILAENKKQALTLLKELLPKGCSVTHGGCTTLAEIGGISLLKSGNYEYIDRTNAKNPYEVYQKGYGADFFLTSAGAVTENGELYNVDGYSNRISAIAFGPKKVIVIVGINKIVPTLSDAVYRVKTVAAPKNAARLHCNTYCAKNGKCISLLKSNPGMTEGCDSPDRICRNYLISSVQQDPERITVIIVNEPLGF